MKRALALLSVFAVSMPGYALAHAKLVSSSPADGGVLAGDAKAIELAFDGLIAEASCHAADAAGKAVALGAVHFEREKVHVPLTAALAPGAYVLTCKVKADRHEVEHGIKFTVK